MNWEEKRLDELGFVGRGKSRHRPRDAEFLYGGPYPFVQTSDIKHAGLYLNSYTQTYSEAGLEQSKLWPTGTLCITIAANIAETAILGIDACFPDSVIGFIGDKTKCDTRFIKYKFDTIKQQYRQVSQGAAQDNLPLEKLLAFKLSVPSPEIQLEIADVLASYDDLIENNEHRIALLEDAARQLYREWFARLHFPGNEHTKLLEGVPDGWERKALGELCFEVRENVSPEDLEPDTPYMGLEHMPRRSISLARWGRAEEVTSTKHRFRAGEILFGKIRPYFHKVGVAFIDGVASSDAIIIRPISESLHSLVLMTLSSDKFVAYTSQKVKEGSKMPRADWKVMQQYQVLVPQSGLLDAFNSNISTIVEQLKTLNFQNQRARAARDILLPRLMSGEIAV